MEISGELATVGATSAAALVTAMTTDGWGSVRQWFGQWLGRGRAADEELHLARLERDRELLVHASSEDKQELAGRLESAWAVRLQDVADVDGEAALRLRDFVRAWIAEHPGEGVQSRVVTQRADGRGHARITQIGGSKTTIHREGL